MPQLNIDYHTNLFVYEFIEDADDTFKKGPCAGYRAPEAYFNLSTLFTLLQKKPIHLLLFGHKKLAINYLKKLKTLENLYIDWLQIHHFTVSLANQNVFQRYGGYFIRKLCH